MNGTLYYVPAQWALENDACLSVCLSVRPSVCRVHHEYSLHPQLLEARHAGRRCRRKTCMGWSWATACGVQGPSSGFCTCMEQFAVIRQECAVADDVPSWPEDRTFSVIVRSSLGDCKIVLHCNYCLPAATGWQRFCLFFFASCWLCGAPAMSLTWECHLNQYMLIIIIIILCCLGYSLFFSALTLSVGDVKGIRHVKHIGPQQPQCLLFTRPTRVSLSLNWSNLPRVGSGIVRIDPVRFLAGCHAGK